MLWPWWWSSCCCGNEDEDALNEHLLTPIRPVSIIETLIWKCPPTVEAFLQVNDIISLARTSKCLREYCFQVLLQHKRVLVNEPLSALRICPSVRSLRFHQPFITDGLYLYFSHRAITSLVLDNVYWPEQHQPTPTTITLEEVRIYNMRNLSNLNWISPQELQVFHVQRCPKVEFHTLQGLLQQDCGALRVLHLKSQLLGDISAPISLSQLREVDVSSSRNVHSLVQFVVRSCPKLLILDANYTDLYDDDLVGLRHSCVDLQRLTLNSCVNVTDGVVMHIPSSLNCLNLAQTDITDVGLCDLQCSELQKLFISNCIHVTDLGLFSIMRRNARTLQELAISHCRNVRMEEAQGNCTELRTLRCIGIDKDIVSRIMQGNPKLTRAYYNMND